MERILKSQTRKGKRHLLVHWLGHNSDHDSWIAAEHVHNAQ